MSTDPAVLAWNALGDMLTDKGRVSSEIVKDGYRVIVRDIDEARGAMFTLTLTRPTFIEACHAMTSLLGRGTDRE